MLERIAIALATILIEVAVTLLWLKLEVSGLKLEKLPAVRGELPASTMRRATSVAAFQRVQTPTAAKLLLKLPKINTINSKRAMRRCVSCLEKAVPRPFGHIIANKRWNSYDRSALTQDALTQKVQDGLGTDNHARSIKLNLDEKTITTAAGDLPLSPLFDPKWLKARRRQKKTPPSAPSGRFRTKLHNNPFGMGQFPMRRASH